MATNSAIALLSAGLDSSMAVYLAREAGYTIKGAVTFDYGQRAMSREVAQARKLSIHLGFKHTVIELPWFRKFENGGALLTPALLPQPSHADLDDQTASEASAKAVWVPNRNGVFLEIAAGLAEDAGASHIIVGFNREEAATFADNSVAYREAMTKALSFSTSNQVRVLSPTETLSKPQIVAEAIRLNFPFEFLWSCYEAHEKMCGRCESCMRLKRALHANESHQNAIFIDSNLA